MTEDKHPGFIEEPYGIAYMPISGRWLLTRHGYNIVKRMRQFKRADWKTERGAQAAADKLNSKLLTPEIKEAMDAFKNG